MTLISNMISESVNIYNVLISKFIIKIGEKVYRTEIIKIHYRTLFDILNFSPENNKDI
jgi:hypothetical protein